jgi:putative hemolysin
MRLALPAALVLLAGCAPTPVPEAPPVIGMANPASVSCIDNGGRSEIRNTPAGQMGVCVFHDGRQCEEWALFRDHRCVAP